MEEHEQQRDAFGSDEEYKLHCLRHSAAHLMAQAVMRLHPEASLAIGPAIDDGFYYDIALDTPLSEDALGEISAEMKRIVKENQKFEREDWSKDQAREYFGARGQNFKLELIDGFADATVSVYRNPAKKPDREDFVDLCAGPHVMRTGQLKHFRLTKVSGAYWRADANNAQLQRVYGTVWPNREQLDAYMTRIEEAKKRDHRKIGREMELFMFHEYSPGAAFWLPNGEIVYHLLAERMRTLLESEGYHVVRTPLVFDKQLWETSGHWAHYKDGMYHVGGLVDGDGDAERSLGLKPMNCPSHMLIFKNRLRSYRELPLRLHDQGVLHRNEMSGTLSGLTRVRQFCQDDAHLFCTEDQIESEVGSLLKLVDRVYSAFDMTYVPKLSTRPADRMGEESLWDLAESSLQNALDSRGIEWKLNAGDGVFYGPKIDFDILDALGRAHQCATIQLDFQLPRRFELTYAAQDGSVKLPIVIHRALFGSFERFIGILIEHYAGKFPVWLAPEQVRVLTVSEKSNEHARKVTDALAASGCRVQLDASDNKIGYKIREGHSRRVPYMAIVGEQETAGNSVSVRARDDGDLGAMGLDSFVAKLAEESEPPL